MKYFSIVLSCAILPTLGFAQFDSATEYIDEANRQLEKKGI